MTIALFDQRTDLRPLLKKDNQPKHARSIRFQLLSVVNGVLVLLAIVNLMLLRMVVRPLDVLAKKVREVGQHDFGTRVETFGSEELDCLSTEIKDTRSRKLRLKPPSADCVRF